MTKILYCRCSSEGQNPARQLEHANEYDKVFVDMLSGKDTNRPQLQEMLGYIRDGDELYVHELSRLARNTLDLMDLVNKVLAKGAKIHFLKENLNFSPDKDDATSRLILTILGSIAQFERELIAARRTEGIRIAKANGKYKGTKKHLSKEQISELQELAKNRDAWTIKKLMERYKISRASVYNYLKMSPEA